MNKWTAIGISIAVSCFIGGNAVLLFSDKSIIPKTVYVDEYERATTGDFEEGLPKESLVAPLATSTVYLEGEDTIQDWLVKEGDVVSTGQELATLNTSMADEQRSIWETEKDSLERQITEIKSTISTLESERANADSTNSSTDNSSDNLVEGPDDNTLNLGINVDVGVDVYQDGVFAQAIAEAQQKLSEINQKLEVVDAQLAQEGTPAVLSPVEGVIAKIRDDNGSLAIDIYSAEKIIITYATDEQWQDMQMNDRVKIQADGMDDAIEGVILEISQVPANDSEFLSAYKELDPKEQTNPLAYYEMRIQPNQPIDTLPFGNNVNAEVIVNEAKEAVSIKSAWLYDRFENNAIAHVINEKGKAVKTPVSIAFDWKTQSVISEGLQPDSIVVNKPLINDYTYAPSVFFPMPLETPTWQSVKDAGWKFYLRHLIF